MTDRTPSQNSLRAELGLLPWRKITVAAVLVLAVIGIAIYRGAQPTDEEKEAERRAELREVARVECNTLAAEFDDGDPASEAFDSYQRRHGYDAYDVIYSMKFVCPSTYEALKAEYDRGRDAAEDLLNQSTDGQPTWESEDCAARYAAVSSDRFTAEESETLREAVDMDCAALSPSR